MNRHILKIKTFTPLILVVVLLSGCMVGPDFKEPIVEAPESYRTQIMPVEDVTDLMWWELFKDRILFSLVTTALKNNRDLNIAVSRIEQARAAVGFTRADQFPRLDVDAGAVTGNFSGGSKSPDTNSTVYLAAPLSWEIDFWGK